MKIPCISLLTDFGTKDHFAGTMKGVIHGIAPKTTVIDISHEVPPQDIKSAAFLLKCTYSYFPKNTLHLIIVDPGVGSRRKIILVETKNYFFLAPDNGVLSYALETEKVQNVTEITNEKYWLKTVSRTFHGRDIFSPVAAHLANGVSPLKLGRKINPVNLTLFPFPRPVYNKTKNICAGEILYIDRFGNLITNIPEGALRAFKYAKINGKKIRTLASSYSSGKSGEFIALYGSAGFLEISSVNGNAQKKLSANVGGTIRIYF